jgi:putative transposase
LHSLYRFNQRKDRKGAYWEDRHHATAVEYGDHLAPCMVYIDTNMVRAGVISQAETGDIGHENTHLWDTNSK